MPLPVRTVRRVICNRPRASDFQGRVGGRRIIAGGINRPAFFLVAPAADGIEIFQREPERIDDAVAAHTVGRLGEVGNLLAHGLARLEFAVLKLNGIGRRPECAADDVPGEKHASMNRRGVVRIGKLREQQRMGEHARAAVGPHRNFFKPVGGHFGSIKFTEPIIQVQVIGLE